MDSYRQKRPGWRSWVVITATLSVVAVAGTKVAEAKKAKSLHQLIQQEMRLTDFELHTIKLVQPAPEREQILLPVSLNGRDEQLALHRHSLRSDTFQLRVRGVNGIEVIDPPPPPTTWRGEIKGRPGTTVIASIINGSLYASVDDGFEKKWIQPVREANIAADPSLHVMYHSEDVIPKNWSCGWEDVGFRDIDDGGVAGTPSGGCIKLVEIAFDADVEFYQLNGSAVGQTVSDIDMVMNGVDAIYRRDAGITFQIVHYEIRTEEPDNYESTDSFNIANSEMQSEWNSDPLAQIERDVVHLMTGKEIDGDVIGRAATGGYVCDIPNAYAFSQSRFMDDIVSRVALTAHELGHNMYAPHCNQDANCGDPMVDCKIMCQFLDPNFTGCSADRDALGPCTLHWIGKFLDEEDCLDATNQVVWQFESFQAADGEQGDSLGSSVDIEGDRVISGAPTADEDNPKAKNPVIDVGAAYVYRYNTKTAVWDQEAKLFSADPIEDQLADQFGASVDLINDGTNAVAIIGAPNDDLVATKNAGSAYIFRLNGSLWEQEEKLTAGLDTASSSAFGYSVAIIDNNGDETALIGAYFNDSEDQAMVTQLRSGAAYVYRKASGASEWVLETETKKGPDPLVSPDVTPDDFFGFSVALAIDPDTGEEMAFVGALNDELQSTDCIKEPEKCDTGAVHVYRRAGGLWAYEATLFDENGAMFDGFGADVSADVAGDGTLRVLVGAWSEEKDKKPQSNETDSGAAFVFARIFDPKLEQYQWVLESKLQSPSPRMNDFFGTSVAIDESVALVGAFVDDTTAMDSGSAYVFRNSGAGWVYEDRVSPADAMENDLFGASVALDGDQMAIGAPGRDNGMTMDVGWVYVTTPGAVSVADCNGNGTPDSCDISDGTSLDSDLNGVPDECETFCPADLTEDDTVNVNDLLGLIGSWGPCGGCPADLTGDGTVNVDDLLSLIGDWGPCL